MHVLDYARQNPDLLDQLVKAKKLPLSQLIEGTGADRKTLERHRKYIVAILLAYTNGFEIIRGHLSMIKKKGGVTGMKYMVMECHPGYAVVMDNAGRFLKVANLHYEAGQTVTSVLEMTNTSMVQKIIHLRKIWISVAAIAACLCLVVFGGWRFLMSPYGSVRMQINPDVLMTVNRLDYVIRLDGLNDDGDDIIEEYSYQWKKVDLVSDELAGRAVEMGYLKEDGTIRITVESKHEKWKTETEKRIVIVLEDYMNDPPIPPIILTKPRLLMRRSYHSVPSHTTE